VHEVVRRLGNMGIPASMVGEIVESRTVYASSNRAWLTNWPIPRWIPFGPHSAKRPRRGSGP